MWIWKQFRPLRSSQKYRLLPNSSSHDEHTVVGRALMQIRHRPWAQYLVSLPSVPVFRFLVALKTGTDDKLTKF